MFPQFLQPPIESNDDYGRGHDLHIVFSQISTKNVRVVSHIGQIGKDLGEKN